MNYADIELLAITLFDQAMTKNKPKLQRIKDPLWVEIGTVMRNTYRVTAMELLDESSKAVLIPERFK